MNDQIQRELLLPASVAEVWEVVTGDGWLADEVELELIPGGEARFLDDQGLRTGWVEDAQAPGPSGTPRSSGTPGPLGLSGRLVFWWSVDNEPASRVELVLETDKDGSTRLRVTETRPLDVLDVVGIPLRGTGGAGYGPALLAA